MLMTVYAALDRSDLSKEVIPLATAIAHGCGATLCFVHAVSAPDELAKTAGPADLLDTLRLSREQVHHAVLEPVAGSPGEALSGLLRTHPKSMMVMLMRGAVQLNNGEALGPVSQMVLSRTEVPIVFAPPKHRWEDWKPTRILLPQDSTAQCAAAIAPVVPLAQTSKAYLTVLHVPTYSNMQLSPGHDALPLPRYLDQPLHSIQAWREEFIERLRELGGVPPSLNVQLALAMGKPAEEIVSWEKGNRADLIVLPWYRNYGEATILKAVLRGVNCPVMVLPVSPISIRKAA